MVFSQGVAASGFGDFLDQVAVVGNIAAQQLVDAFPRVRMLDTYSLTVVSRRLAPWERHTFRAGLWWRAVVVKKAIGGATVFV